MKGIYQRHLGRGLPAVDTNWTHPITNSHSALKSSAHTGTPRLSFIILGYFDSTIASSLAKDQLKRRLVVQSLSMQ